MKKLIFIFGVIIIISFLIFSFFTFFKSENLFAQAVTIFYETFPNADGAWNGSSDTAQAEPGWAVYQGNGDPDDIRINSVAIAAGTLPPSGGNHLTFNDCDEGFQSPETYDIAYASIDLSFYENVQLTYYWQSDDVDAGEGLRVAYSIDSTNGRDGTWILINSHIDPTDDRWYLETFNIPNSACVSNFKLRFSSRSTDTGENMFVDDVKLTGDFKSAPCQDHNVWGWAWGGAPQASGGEKLGLGWISFSCRNENTGSDYGVDIDINPSSPTYGYLSGYAWSEFGKWITFNESQLINCPVAPCRAWIDSSKKINGWARSCSVFQNGCSGALRSDLERGGWDGWIRLSSALYQTTVDTSTNPAQFRGWAWGDNVMGWISFNCINQGVCAASNYKVETGFRFNSPPTITNMVDPDNLEEYCNIASGIGHVGFEWRYNDVDGDSQTRYDFRVNDVNNVNDANPEINLTVNNPTCIDTDPGQAVSCINTQGATIGTTLNYNTTYYWWVRLYDNQGNDSGWVQGPNFTTDTHAWPWINFSWIPSDPPINTEVQFTDQSSVFGGATKSSWLWTFQNGDPPSSNSQNPTSTFSTRGPNRVELTVRDSTNKVCTDFKMIQLRYPMPGWIEIPPR